MQEAKPYSISKKAVIAAYQRVKANKGTYGVDEQSIEDFERKLNNNLYKIWNRMSSGTYFPKPVKAVAIPKKNGGTRILGIPTVEDRIAQMVAKLYFEPCVEPIFYEDSYGYRPNKSAIQALEATRTRCWRKDWVLEFDIRGLFDNIRHDYLMEMVKKHTKEKWIILYIQRWLTAPFQMEDGTIVERKSGTPQGGVISPVLANLFLHYVFDDFMVKEFPTILSVEMMKDKIRELTKRSNGWGNEYRAMRLTQFVRGWVNYFSLADMKGLTEKTDEWLRHKIRAVYWKQWKKGKTRYRMIKKYGMPKWKVHEMANCRKGI